MVQNDDEAWRAIVDNYGDRPDLDQAGGSGDPASPEQAVEPGQAQQASPREQPTWNDVFPAHEDAVEADDPVDADDRFVPPPPPPLPTTTTDRMIAWTGVFGAPAVLLVLLVLGLRPPALINYVLVMGFVGGFIYLVVKMNPEPRDPDDNGAVI